MICWQEGIEVQRSKNILVKKKIGEPKIFFFTTQDTIVNVPDFCVQNELSWFVLR